MANGTIDLKKKESANANDQARETAAPAAASIRQETAHTDTQALITWSAQEYRHRQRGTGWYLGTGGGGLALVIIGILAQSYFFIVFMVLAYAILIVSVLRPPQEFVVALTHEGVVIGGAFHPFADLKSFWIFARPDGAELSFETPHTFTPHLQIPLGAVQPDRIRAILTEFLPEKEQQETITEHLARFL